VKERPEGTIVFYVSGHGFGHASRVIEVINALIRKRAALRIVVRTSAPRWLFDLTVRGALEYEYVECDTGVVQIDSLRLDEEASIARAIEFMSSFEERVGREAERLKNVDAGLVVADMPPLGVAAGAQAGVPVAALGNFTWDWIYSAYPGSDRLVRMIREAYSEADVALRLPMWGGFEAFERVVDLPFVARRSARDPEDVRRAFSLPHDKRLVLTSFGGHGREGIASVARDMNGYAVLFTTAVPAGQPPSPPGTSVPPMDLRRQAGTEVLFVDERQLYAGGFRYEDLVRAVDVVITKPGYGIIAECLANDTALLYTSRGLFIEYDVLVDAMPQFLRTAFIDHSDLFDGRWRPHLDALLAQPAPGSKPATNGASVAADALLAML